MKKATKTAAEISERLNLPVGVTRITLAGTRQALIEGHRGLAGYTPERVTVRAQNALEHRANRTFAVRARNVYDRIFQMWISKRLRKLCNPI